MTSLVFCCNNRAEINQIGVFDQSLLIEDQCLQYKLPLSCWYHRKSHNIKYQLKVISKN